MVCVLNGEGAGFAYHGLGATHGTGASGNLYIGLVGPIQRVEDYAGENITVGVTFSVGGAGVTAFYFWDASGGPFTPGNMKGGVLGWAPGAQLSVWGSYAYYHQITD